MTDFSLDAIRVRAAGLTAKPASDGHYYGDLTLAVADREHLLTMMDDMLAAASWRPEFDCAACDHSVQSHQTGMGAYTGWCCVPECECERPVKEGD